jgi:uncharacterized protein (TIGR03032 family)
MDDQIEFDMKDLRVSVSYSFHDWLAQSGGSLAVTNMGGGLVLIGMHNGKLSMIMRAFQRATGLLVHGPHLVMGTNHEIHYFVNSPKLATIYPKAEPQAYDGIFIPRRTYTTGRINTHDIGLGSEAIWICNTAFSCLCILNDEWSFEPRWKPPFISELAPEDRCHLNGLTIRDGFPKYVSCLGETDTKHGWRPNINTGGCILETDSNEVIVRGLAMPHSPRWYRDKLYFLNSAAGELCVMDLNKGSYDVICCMPGMVRGMSFAGDTAIIGLSLLRSKAYEKMPRRPVQDRFDKLLCGVALVDLKTGKPFALLEFTTVVGELYDTAFLPGLRRPTLLSSAEQPDEVQCGIHLEGQSWWLPDDDKKKFAVNPGAAAPAANNPTPAAG